MGVFPHLTLASTSSQVIPPVFAPCRDCPSCFASTETVRDPCFLPRLQCLINGFLRDCPRDLAIWRDLPPAETLKQNHVNSLDRKPRLPRSGKNFWKMNFFRVRENSGNFVVGQGNLERTWKVGKKSGNLKINGY